jgi:predicted nuclease of restriction endonuclease-like (RecB) superfamily
MVHIKENLYEAQGQKEIKTSNFQLKLPPPQSHLAEETLKDPYKFHFLTIGDGAHEKEVHGGLLDHIKQFNAFPFD